MEKLIIIIIFGLSSILFSKAAGGLDIRRLNIISFAYYNILVFSFIGASFVFCGFRDHYLIQKIQSSSIIIQTYLILSYIMLMLPCSILFFNRLFCGKNIRHKYKNYINLAPEMVTGSNKLFICLSWLTLVGILSCIYVFSCIGMIPAFHMSDLGGSQAAIRINITRNFSGNIYIRNLIFQNFNPIISYFSYLIFRVTRKKKWLLLFIINLLLSLLIKTYNFEKAPILYYFFYFCILEILLNNRHIIKLIGFCSIVCFIIIIIQYKLIGNYQNTVFTLSSGPLGRIFMTQISTLFLHIQTFPHLVPYLNGGSLPTVLARIIGQSVSWRRSGRVVMEIYNRSGINAGTAGVMNALFVGEAYANWGLMGVIISPIVVAFWFSFAFSFLLNTKKTPINMMIYLIFFMNLTTGLQGGFIDFLYNMACLLILCFCYLLYIGVHNGKIGIYRPLRIKKF